MPPNILIQDFLVDKHDHAGCVGDALARADEVCRNRGERFTPLRRAVLELVWSSHKPVKAYDILAGLAETRDRPAPPTVYRALDFLLEAGLIHRIQSLNAFVGCAEPGRRHQGQFLICEECGTVAEIDDAAISARIDSDARKMGFKVSEETIEISGLCRKCR